MRVIVRITKDEKEQIVKKYSNAPVVRLVKKDSKRHHYWMAEEPHLMKLLNKIRKAG